MLPQPDTNTYELKEVTACVIHASFMLRINYCISSFSIAILWRMNARLIVSKALVMSSAITVTSGLVES